MPKPILIYVGDPMCSWCWGLAPVMAKLLQNYATKLEFEILLGGLRPGNKAVVDDEMADFLRHHWERVHELSGQDFDFSLLEKRGWFYNTEPACRAVITARGLYGSLKGMEFFKFLQKSYYSGGQIITSDEVIEQLAIDAGFDGAEFMAHFKKDEMSALTLNEFQDVSAMGVSGFPTLIMVHQEQATLLLNGFGDYETVRGRLDSYLAEVV